MMMASAFHAERFQAPAEKVWRFLDWPNVELMIPSGFITHVEYEERRPLVGATRWLTLSDGRRIRERLEALPDHAGDYAFEYRLIDLADLPLAEYLGSLRLTPAGDNACNLRMSCRFTPLGVSVADWQSIYVEMQTMQCAFIRAAVA